MNSMNPNCSKCSGQRAMPYPVNNDPLHGMPVAMAYVPMQQFSQTYNLCDGFSRGTIFPCLDLPFYGCIPRNQPHHNKGGRA